MQIVISGKRYGCQTLEQAAEIYRAAWDQACAKGRVIRGAMIRGANGADFYRVSQNGKIWPLEDWTPEQRPVFDPYA